MALPISLQATEVGDTFLHEKHEVFPEGYGSPLFFKQPRTCRVCTVCFLFIPGHKTNKKFRFPYSFNNRITDEPSHIVARNNFEAVLGKQVLEAIDVLLIGKSAGEEHRITANIWSRRSGRQPLEDLVDLNRKILERCSISRAL